RAGARPVFPKAGAPKPTSGVTRGIPTRRRPPSARAPGRMWRCARTSLRGSRAAAMSRPRRWPGSEAEAPSARAPAARKGLLGLRPGWELPTWDFLRPGPAPAPLHTHSRARRCAYRLRLIHGLRRIRIPPTSTRQRSQSGLPLFEHTSSPCCCRGASQHASFAKGFNAIARARKAARALTGSEVLMSVRALTLADVAVPRAGALDNVVLVASASLLTALGAQLAIPLPWSPVPIPGQTFAVLLSGAVLGARRAFLAQALYLAEGALGLPVFASGAAGIAQFAGPTGGY